MKSVDSRQLRRRKVLISHQGCVPIYRKGLFDKLGQVEDIEYHVVHGPPPPGSDLITAPEPYNFSNSRIRPINLKIGRRVLIYQPVIRRALKGEFDAAVLGEDLKFVSNILLRLILRLQGRPVLLWGFGYHQMERAECLALDALIEKGRSFLKRAMLALSSAYIVYTCAGARRLAEEGYAVDRISVIGNTVDVVALRALEKLSADETPQEIRRRFGLPADIPVLLYFGRFWPAKKIELLIDYARHAKTLGRPVGILIFGKGSEERRLRAAACGLEEVIIRSHDDFDLARAHRIAEAVVIPGFVGLAITHAFAHGLPVITREAQFHSPEIDYLESGCNGLMAPESSQEFFMTLDQYLGDDALRASLREGARASAQKFDMLQMAAVFDGCVRSCLAYKRP